jgi:hypothetical protein
MNTQTPYELLQEQLRASIAAAEKLRAPLLPSSNPMTQVQPGQMTIEQVQQIVDARLKELNPGPAKAMQQLQNSMQAFESMFQRALPAADYKAFQEYVANGSPGFNDILQSDKLFPLAQLLWETIKEHTK